MEIKNITQTQLASGLLRLTPDNGYMLYDDRTQKQYSEAVVKESDVRHFSAVKI